MGKSKIVRQVPGYQAYPLGPQENELMTLGGGLLNLLGGVLLGTGKLINSLFGILTKFGNWINEWGDIVGFLGQGLWDLQRVLGQRWKSASAGGKFILGLFQFILTPVTFITRAPEWIIKTIGLIPWGIGKIGKFIGLVIQKIAEKTFLKLSNTLSPKLNLYEDIHDTVDSKLFELFDTRKTDKRLNPNRLPTSVASLFLYPFRLIAAVLAIPGRVINQFGRIFTKLGKTFMGLGDAIGKMAGQPMWALTKKLYAQKRRLTEDHHGHGMKILGLSLGMGLTGIAAGVLRLPEAILKFIGVVPWGAGKIVKLIGSGLSWLPNRLTRTLNHAWKLPQKAISQGIGHMGLGGKLYRKFINKHAVTEKKLRKYAKQAGETQYKYYVTRKHNGGHANAVKMGERAAREVIKRGFTDHVYGLSQKVPDSEHTNYNAVFGNTMSPLLFGTKRSFMKYAPFRKLETLPPAQEVLKDTSATPSA